MISDFIETQLFVQKYYKMPYETIIVRRRFDRRPEADLGEFEGAEPLQ
jgi:hypothetical protein